MIYGVPALQAIFLMTATALLLFDLVSYIPNKRQFVRRILERADK